MMQEKNLQGPLKKRGGMKIAREAVKLAKHAGRKNRGRNQTSELAVKKV